MAKDIGQPNSGDADAEVSSWRLPAWNKQGKIIKSAELEAKQAAAGKGELVENVSRKSRPKPLTAEELKAISDQAQQEGYADGFKEGMEKGLQQGEQTGLKNGEAKAYKETRTRLENETQRIKAIADRLLQPALEQDEELEKMLVEMSVTIAKKLLIAELQQQPEKVLNVIHKALNELPVGAKNITVCVCEEDAKLIEKLVPKSHRSWRIQEDSSLEQGGCKVLTAESLVDFSIAARVKNYLNEAQQHSETPAEISNSGES